MQMRIVLICIENNSHLRPVSSLFGIQQDLENCVISEETARSVYRVEIEGSRIDGTLKIDFGTAKIEDRDGCLVFVSISNHDLSE